MSWITPGKRAERRRTHWSSFEEALEYFRGRPLYKNFSESALNDFVEYGTEEKNGSRVLKFDPFVESRIYHTLPHNYSQFKHKLQVPAASLIGRQTDVIQSLDIRTMKKQFNMLVKVVEGSHLFPF